MRVEFSFEDMGGGKIKVGMKPDINKIMAEVSRAGKCGPAEEMAMIAYEAVMREGIKNRAKNKSGVIIAGGRA
jgi:hypothetical protein